jgi:hypothetical protein
MYKLYLRLIDIAVPSLARVLICTPNSVKFVTRSVQYSTQVRDTSRVIVIRIPARFFCH